MGRKRVRKSCGKKANFSKRVRRKKREKVVNSKGRLLSGEGGRGEFAAKGNKEAQRIVFEPSEQVFHRKGKTNSSKAVAPEERGEETSRSDRRGKKKGGLARKKKKNALIEGKRFSDRGSRKGRGVLPCVGRIWEGKNADRNRSRGKKIKKGGSTARLKSSGEEARLIYDDPYKKRDKNE